MIDATELFGTSLPIIVAVFIGIVVLLQQCRQLTRRSAELLERKWQGGSALEVEPLREQIRQVQETVRLSRSPSFEALAQELQSLKKLQREVKSQLAGLRTLVDKAPKKIKAAHS
jgi:uncharacterized membrane protein